MLTACSTAAASGDDHLTGSVVVGGRHHAGNLSTGTLHRRLVQAENRGHRPLARAHRLLHQLPASMHQAHRSGEVEGAGTDQGRILTKAVPGHQGRQPAAAVPPNIPKGDAGGQQRRLGNGGSGQCVFRPLAGDAPKVDADGVGSFGKALPHLRVLHGHIGQHADELGTLPRKHEA